MRDAQPGTSRTALPHELHFEYVNWKTEVTTMVLRKDTRARVGCMSIAFFKSKPLFEAGQDRKPTAQKQGRSTITERENTVME
jgi:hypothetical protein